MHFFRYRSLSDRNLEIEKQCILRKQFLYHYNCIVITTISLKPPDEITKVFDRIFEINFFTNFE
jgi:hypothetical protein